jgi:anti-sigma factor RsiW
MTINCPSREDIFTHLDGEGPGDTRGALAEHLHACPQCAAVAREFEALTAALGAVPDIDPRADFATRLRETRARAAISSALFPLFTPVRAVALAALLLGVALGSRYGPTPSRSAGPLRAAGANIVAELDNLTGAPPNSFQAYYRNIMEEIR